MVKDTMANDRLIGMALLRGDWEKAYYGNPDLYSVGCVGEIVNITPFPDGRYNLVLHGLREYEIQEHIIDRSLYRQARVLVREETKESKVLPASLKAEILGLMERTIGENESDLRKILTDPSLDEETWLNLCCFSLDVSILEKQSLLEAKSQEERATYLLNALHFKLVEKGTLFEGLGELKERRH
jgi:Lon protease-like protein